MSTITKLSPSVVFSQYSIQGKNNYVPNGFFNVKPSAKKKKYINPISTGSFSSGQESYLEFLIPTNEFIVDLKFSEIWNLTGTAGNMDWAPLTNIEKIEFWMNGNVFQTFDKHFMAETQYNMASSDKKTELNTANNYYSTKSATGFRFILNCPYFQNIQNSSDREFYSRVMPPISVANSPIYRIYFNLSASNIYVSNGGGIWLPSAPKLAVYYLSLGTTDRNEMINYFNGKKIPIYNSIASAVEQKTFSGTTDVQWEVNMDAMKNKLVLGVISKILINTYALNYQNSVGEFTAKSGFYKSGNALENFTEDNFYELKTKENDEFGMVNSNIHTNYFFNSYDNFDIEKSIAFLFDNDSVSLRYNNIIGVTAENYNMINEILLIEGYEYHY